MDALERFKVWNKFVDYYWTTEIFWPGSVKWTVQKNLLEEKRYIVVLVKHVWPFQKYIYAFNFLFILYMSNKYYFIIYRQNITIRGTNFSCYVLSEHML